MKLFKSKLNNKGFGHIETILIVLVVAVIAGVGFFVYQNHSKTGKKTTTHAGGWTYILNTGNLQYGGNVNIWACKAQWGSLEQVKVAYTKAANVPAYWFDSTVTITTNNGASKIADAGWSNSYYAGTIAVQTLYFNTSNLNKYPNIYINMQSTPNFNYLLSNVTAQC
ncbi:MAG TPA: hypothetical protein VIH90_07255 [Candidatus Saccharimonadales bacterium]